MKYLRWILAAAAVSAVGAAMAQSSGLGILKDNKTAFTGKTQTGDATGNITIAPYPNLIGSTLTSSGTSAYKGNGTVPTTGGTGSTTTGSGILNGGNNAFNSKGGKTTTTSTGTTTPAVKSETQVMEVTNLPLTAGDLPLSKEMNLPAQNCDSKPVPEPTTMAVLGIGAIAAALRRRKKSA